VQIKEVKLDYTAESGKPGAWDEDKERFYINFKADSDGRKVTITAKLTEPIKEVKLDYTAESGKPGAWDEDKERFYINFKADSDGRKVTITAKLTEPI